ncbi:NADH-quinone oxidoreductase subunit L [Chloroflexota bacterium]
MIPYQLVWLIMLLPLFSFVVNGLIVRLFVKPESKIYGYITIGAIGTSAIFSIWALISVMSASHHELPVPDVSWLVIENGVTIHLGLILDSLTAVMVVVVSIVSLMVQIYSLGYMHGDPAGYSRYYTWMSLFTFSMLGLVLSDNLLFTFVFWEMVGLCSYLLIGFWFHKKSAADAAKKAFIVTRIGDFGFLAGILILFLNTGTFDIHELHELAIAGILGGAVLMWAAIGIFAGAVGKSAQFPLHVWLPDAMEGPTPVSALIHSATMVCAGVFLVARTFPLFEHSVSAMTTVAIIGGFTAIFAATIGLVAYDIKRVLAYSTISQLGYMMLGLATGGVAVGIFHLFTHAFFKALLFMGSGSVHHSTGTFDMRLMGGLRKTMPWTYATFLIGSLSLAGIWPLSGFWSKDEILVSSLANQPVLFWLAMITVFLTAFYMFRAIYMTFHGAYRGGATDDGVDHHHTHESPWVMVGPLVFLAILAICAGWWNVAGGFSELMGHGGGHGVAHSFIEGLFAPFTHTLPVIALLVGLAGIFMAYVIYCRKWINVESIGKVFGPLYTLVFRKYFFDELYENVIVKLVLMKGLFTGFTLFDSKGVDGAVNGVAGGVIGGGRVIRHAQTGQLQLYGLFIGIGVVIISLCVYFFG